MTSPSPASRVRGVFARTIAVAMAAMALAPGSFVEAAPSPARLSADLADHLRAGSQSIKVIVHGTRAEVDALAQRYNLRIVKYLSSGAVFLVNAGQLEALQQDGTVDHLSGDTRIRSLGDFAAETMGADQLWAGDGSLPQLTGKGVTVAVVDSGIGERHAALQKRVLKTVDFTGGNGADQFGHGTHVAGIIAGQPGTTAETAEYRGIASAAYLVNLRVLGADGSGDVSSVIEALDWAVANKNAYRIGVINLSLGAPVLQPYRDDPLCEAVERAVRAGIVVVAAAGNHGQADDGRSIFGAITTPGNSPYALTVGAMDTHGTPQRSDDTLAPYSSKGPTVYDLVIKPDLAAPGNRIVAPENVGSTLSSTYPELHIAGTGANSYMRLSGTSMAAGEVSGAVALLLDQRPGLTPADAKAALQMTSTFVPEAGLLGAGAGNVDVLAAAVLSGRQPNYSSLSIGLEDIQISGISFNTTTCSRPCAQRLSGSRNQTIIWGQVLDKAQTTLRSQHDAGDTIIWGQSDDGDTIIWGQHDDGDTIIWGQHDDGDTIIWGQHDDGDTIIWGQSDDGDTIIWGQSDDGDTIIWGQHDDGDTIIWGQHDDGDTIIWGQHDDGDTIIWGQSDDGDTIIWGQSVTWDF